MHSARPPILGPHGLSPALPLPPAVESLGASNNTEAPITLGLRVPHPLVAGCAGLIQVQLRSSELMADGVALLLQSNGIAEERRHRIDRIRPGVPETILLDVSARQAGHHVLSIQVELGCRPSARAFGGATALRILHAPDPHVEIHIGDIQCHKSCGANSGLGAEYGNVALSHLLGDAPLPSLNELLAQEFTKSFLPVPLAAVAAVREIPESAAPASRFSTPVHDPALAERCVLRALNRAVRSVRLMTGPEFRIGRSRTQADLACAFLPHNATNDARSLRLSKNHVALLAGDSAIWIRDLGSTNGSRLDGRPLETEPVPLALSAAGRTIVLAGGYEITFESFATAAAAQANGDARAVARHEAAAVGGLRFRRPRTTGEVADVIWLLSTAGIGSALDAALRCADSSVAPLQGELAHSSAGFVFRNLAANPVVSIDLSPLAQGESAPLRAGMHLRIGQGEWVVEAWS